MGAGNATPDPAELEETKGEIMAITPTLKGAELYPQGAANDAEARLIAQYRRLKNEHTAHGRPFTITFVFSGPDVFIFGGRPSGRIDMRDEK